MVKRVNNQLPQNLPQLQNLIKRDPLSYKDEFLQQLRHYKSLLSLFQLHPNQFNKGLNDLVMFMAQVAQCYPEELQNFAQELLDVLHDHNTVLDSEMRMMFCRALILLRNKNLLTPTDLLSQFFQLLRSKDKVLRKFLETHIINDIKNVNAKHKDVKLNTTLQNFMFTMLNDNNGKAAKMSLNIMIELYKKNVWNDVKTVNVLATACFSKITKVMVTALNFFLSINKTDKEEEESSSDEDEVTARDVLLANKYNKKTRKRQKNLKKAQQLVKKSKKKTKAPTYNFSALHLIHDPQGMAEKLFKQLESRHERFEVKVMTLDLISRLIGIHKLLLLNFYPYIQRFLQPHQREVTKLMQFIAQASHDLVPPDALEPILNTLVNNFISERNTSDVMAIGLNAVRELCLRNPVVMNEDLLKDLVQYKNYRDRSVMMAARSLIHLFRHSLPTILHKKDRGRPTAATIELKTKKYGEVDAPDCVPGADAILDDTKMDIESDKSESDDEEWIDVSQSEDDGNEDSDDEEEEDESDNDDNEGEDGDSEGEITEINDKEENVNKDQNIGTNKTSQKTDSKEKAVEISIGRILTDEDFKKIEAAKLAKHLNVNIRKKGVKRPVEEEQKTSELVAIGDIENIYKKRKHSKEDRIASIRNGQEGREKFGYKDGRQNPFSSKTNRENKKKKHFMMIKHKARGKVKRSFKDKQIALRNHLLKLKRMK